MTTKEKTAELEEVRTEGDTDYPYKKPKPKKKHLKKKRRPT